MILNYQFSRKKVTQYNRVSKVGEVEDLRPKFNVTIEYVSQSQQICASSFDTESTETGEAPERLA